MPRYLAVLAIVLLLATVLGRVVVMRRNGTKAMHFGGIDKTDFLIPPVMLFYFYTVCAAGLGWPLVSSQRFFSSTVLDWVGAALCLAGVLILVLSIVSFGRSFRVGIDVDKPGPLVTDGIFAVSRNPIYVGFFVVLVGQFLVFPNWIPLAYLIGGSLLFHRQVLREEEFMRQRYGQEFVAYCRSVRRYV